MGTNRTQSRFVVEIRSSNNERLADLEVSGEMKVNELLTALQEGFGAEVFSKPDASYLRSLYPIAFLHGSRTLSFYGLRQGSVILL